VGFEEVFLALRAFVWVNPGAEMLGALGKTGLSEI